MTLHDNSITLRRQTRKCRKVSLNLENGVAKCRKSLWRFMMVTFFPRKPAWTARDKFCNQIWFGYSGAPKLKWANNKRPTIRRSENWWGSRNTLSETITAPKMLVLQCFGAMRGGGEIHDRTPLISELSIGRSSDSSWPKGPKFLTCHGTAPFKPKTAQNKPTF